MFSPTDSSVVRFGEGIHYATPIVPSTGKTTELDLVRAVLQMMQGLSCPHFRWDPTSRRFSVTHTGIYVTHLSRTSLHSLLNHFAHAATCLKLVHLRVSKLELETRMPTLSAFASLASQWLQRLRDIALKEEAKMCNSDAAITPTLLGLSSSLSSLSSGAECLLQIVDGAIPQVYFASNSSITAAQMSAHILDYLYKKLDQVCLVQGGEEEAYQMVLHMFVGSVLPYIEGIDSWLFEGTLDDPFEEMFFYADGAISVDKSEFWEKSYQLRQVQHQKLDVVHAAVSSSISLTTNKKEGGEKGSISLSSYTRGKEHNNEKLQMCPLFIKEIAQSIVSAGKSLQLIQHVSVPLSDVSAKVSHSSHRGIDGFGGSINHIDLSSCRQSFAGLTLSEIFCISVAALIGHSAHISTFFLQDDKCKSEIVLPLVLDILKKKAENGIGESMPSLTYTEKAWYRSLIDALSEEKAIYIESMHKERIDFSTKEYMFASDKSPPQGSFLPENPVITVCQELLDKHRDSCSTLRLSRNLNLPPLNDGALREAVFGLEKESSSALKATNYTFGFHFGKSEYLRSENDANLLDGLFPFPTLLPSFQDNVRVSELLPFQKNSTLLSKVLTWLQTVEPGTTPLPVVIVQDCLAVYIKKQVSFIGGHMLLKLMNDWRLMDELAVLRAIYLLGSGDLLQHFLTVIFSKLDKGETWDDDFELNTILQESVRNSADGMLLSAPDALVVSITKNNSLASDELPGTPTLASRPRKSNLHSSGIDGLDSLKFSYRVSWPLELIANSEAIKKYNQVMRFLLKVKRAKSVLDKTRRWMWKDKGRATTTRKHQWLVEQKLLHFVDAFHQYVMDRVYHSAWRELCEGVAAAGSLDEVIEVHEAYLLSIQRQCFVVPDKLWALIASRINSILGLALEFYTIQQTLSTGGATSAMRARCEMEIDNIEKRFDDCIAFLLRVLSFRLNVGHFPHLADLVTRINYNHFYMSDAGNLMTSSSK